MRQFATSSDIMTDTTSTKPPERWLSVNAAAAHIGVSRATLYRYLELEGLPSHQPAGARGRRLFDVAEIDAWLRNRCSDRGAA